jgi:hypothetical protein
MGAGKGDILSGTRVEGKKKRPGFAGKAQSRTTGNEVGTNS